MNEVKTVYAIYGASGIVCAIVYWTGNLEVSAAIAGCYAFSWGCMCVAEALRD